MTQDEYNEYCGSLPHAHHVMQWGGADVWKIGGISGEQGSQQPVGGKMFAVGGWNKKDSDEYCVTFKTGEIAFEILSDVEGCRPAPYLASRGMKWIQRTGAGYMSSAELQTYIKDSYKLVSLGLTKKCQKELGLNQEGAA